MSDDYEKIVRETQALAEAMKNKFEFPPDSPIGLYLLPLCEKVSLGTKDLSTLELISDAKSRHRFVIPIGTEAAGSLFRLLQVATQQTNDNAPR